MNYIEVSTKKIVTFHHVRRANPNISLPRGRDFPHLGYRLINSTPRPEPDPDHYVATDMPVEIDGEWYEAWRQVPYNVDESVDDPDA